MDTHVADQKKRARVYRPAPANNAVRVTSDAVSDPGHPSLIRRETFIAPIGGLDLDSKLFPAPGPRRDIG